MLVFNPRRPSVHPLLLDELAAVRVDDLRRRATPERPAPPLRPSPPARAGWRSLHPFANLLVGAGLRPAAAGERSDAAGRGVV
jgi:hypothetical protein